MKKDHKFISKIVELETITPLFIKGKEIDYGEGMLRGDDERIYLIDNNKLCDYIYCKTYDESGNRIQKGEEFDYVQVYSDEFSKSKSPSLKKFFDDHPKIRPFEEDLRKMAKGITRIPEGKKFARNGLDKPFIPGSSIKGAIRNAVLWKILSDPDKKQWLKSFVKVKFEHLGKRKLKDIDGNKADKKYLNEKFSTHFGDAQNIKLSDKSFTIDKGKIQGDHSERWKETDEALRDFFRIVKISDANFTEEDVSLKTETARAVCVTGKQTYQKNFDIPLECLTAGSKAKFRITIDLEMAKNFFGKEIPYYLGSVEGLLETANEFFKEVWNFEENFFKDKSPIKNKKRVDTKKVYEFYCDERYDCYRYRWQFSKEDFAPWVEKFPQLSNISMPPHKIKDGKYLVDIDILLNDKQSTAELGEDFLNEIQKQKPNQYLLRTGWGGGMMGKTQFLHLEPKEREDIRNLKMRRLGELAPKSRCLVVDEDRAEYPLGWCCLKILDENDLPGIDKVKIKEYLGTSSAKTEGGDIFAEKLEKAKNRKNLLQTGKGKSRYKIGERIKKNVEFKKQGNTYLVNIKGQDELATLIGEPNYMASVVKVTIGEIIDGIVTKVRKV